MRLQKEERVATVCPLSLAPKATPGLWPSGTQNLHVGCGRRTVLKKRTLRKPQNDQYSGLPDPGEYDGLHRRPSQSCEEV